MPTKKTAKPATGDRSLSALRKRLIHDLGAGLAPFIREEVADGRSQREVVESLRRTAPAALLLQSLPSVTAMVEAAITVAELAIADEIDPPPTSSRRRRKATA